MWNVNPGLSHGLLFQVWQAITKCSFTRGQKWGLEWLDNLQIHLHNWFCTSGHHMRFNIWQPCFFFFFFFPGALSVTLRHSLDSAVFEDHSARIFILSFRCIISVFKQLFRGFTWVWSSRSQHFGHYRHFSTFVSTFTNDFHKCIFWQWVINF